MKNLLRILIIATFAIAARAANTTIEGISTTIVLPNSTDYIPVSGATRGTTKLALSGLGFMTANRTTLAALSITGAADGSGINVLGAASAGDGGGSPYFWSASSTATPNGDTVIQPASLPGTGRWLKAPGGIITPGVSNIGGVFSNVGVSHQWISAINTNGTVTLTQPSAGDITGLGSMAVQNSSSVAISGGTINGVTIGGTMPAAGSFTSVNASGTITSSNATGGSIVVTDGTVQGAIYTSSGPSDLRIGTSTNHPVSLMVSNSSVGQLTTTGLNSIAIGQTTPAAGSFLAIIGNLLTVKLAGGITRAPFGAAATQVLGTSGSAVAETIDSEDAASEYIMRRGDTAGTGALVTNDILGFIGYAGKDNSAFTSASARIQATATENWTTSGHGTQIDIYATANGSASPVVGASVTATGINSTAIGATTPGTIVATNYASDTLANQRASKGNFNVITNVKDYGAKGDGKSVTSNVSINSGTAALTVAGASFVPGDVGKTIVVPGAGAAGADFITTIQTYTSGTQVSLASTASTTLVAVSKQVVYGTDDTTAINNAIAALTSNATLYLPTTGGIYVVQGLSGFSSLNHITVRGDGIGSRLFTIVNANNLMTFNNTCSYVTVCDLALEAIGTARGNGIGVRMQCSHGTITRTFISGLSDFGAFFDDTSTTVTDCKFTNNTVYNTLGDGVHLSNVSGFVVTGNVFYTVGDDAIAPLGVSPNPCQHGTISGNTIYGRTADFAGTGTHGNRGIAIQWANDVLVEANDIYNTYSTGIEVADDAATSNYCQYIKIRGNNLYNCEFTPGPLACIELYFGKHCEISGNTVYSPNSNGGASCILVSDFVDVTISDNTLSQPQNLACRGIVVNGSTSYSGRTFATTWSDLYITNNHFNLNQGSSLEAIYFVPNAAITVNRVGCSGNQGSCSNAWLTFDKCAKLTVVTNVALGANSTISTGTSTSVTSTPNY